MSSGTGSSDNIYFGNQDSTKLAGICLEKGDTFFKILNRNDYINKIRRMWRFYHGIFGDVSGDHQVNFTGEQGELVTLPVNHFRNLAQHIYTMITTNRPVMEARSINTDYKSLSQTYLANGILDYYMREKGMENALKKACEMSIVMGAAFVKMDWNATAGEAYDADPETGAIDYEGEMEFRSLSPLDVVVDGTKENWDDEWVIVRGYQNRYNLMAKYPEWSDKILGLPSKMQIDNYYSLSIWSNDDTDEIPVYEFFHRKCEAVPEGRYLLFLAADVPLVDVPLPYRKVPVFRVAPGDILGTPYGYTPMFDIFPIQEGINSLYSTILTNQNAFGVQNIWLPKNSDINIASMPGGLNIVESTVEPKPLNLTQTPAEVFKFLDLLIQSAETISGVNSVARGNPEASLKSGTALALVQSMAIQYISGLQQSYVQLIENVGTALIQNLKDFAQTPKLVALVGKNNRTDLKQFTGEDINSINRVIVDMGNPLSHTIAGRVQMADNLLQYQIIDNPYQYFQVLNTGRLDALYENEMNELLLIKAENEKLMDGVPVEAIAVDAHKEHIMEHKGVLADPDIRKDNNLVQAVLNHIQQHIKLLQTTDPNILQMTGQQPLPPPGQPEQPPQGPPQGAPPPGHQAPPAPQGSPQGAPVHPGMPQPLPAKPPLQAVRRDDSPKILGPQAPMAAPGVPVMGPNQELNRLPSLPQVSPNLLPNPGLQQMSIGNLKQPHKNRHGLHKNHK
jgi:hypothetical protein